MAEEKLNEHDADAENFEELRSAIRHFDRVVRSQIAIQSKQGDRIRYSIRAGMLFLCLIAISIFVILITMVTQVQLISQAVTAMSDSFNEVKVQMVEVDDLMTKMEANVSSMSAINDVMQGMDGEMTQMSQQMQAIQAEVETMRNEVKVIRQQADVMTYNAGVMDMEIYRMNQEVNRMSAPARSLNNMFPIP